MTTSIKKLFFIPLLAALMICLVGCSENETNDSGNTTYSIGDSWSTPIELSDLKGVYEDYSHASSQSVDKNEAEYSDNLDAYCVSKDGHITTPDTLYTDFCFSLFETFKSTGKGLLKSEYSLFPMTNFVFEDDETVIGFEKQANSKHLFVVNGGYEDTVLYTYNREDYSETDPTSKLEVTDMDYFNNPDVVDAYFSNLINESELATFNEDSLYQLLSYFGIEKDSINSLSYQELVQEVSGTITICAEKELGYAEEKGKSKDSTTGYYGQIMIYKIDIKTPDQPFYAYVTVRTKGEVRGQYNVEKGIPAHCIVRSPSSDVAVNFFTNESDCDEDYDYKVTKYYIYKYGWRIADSYVK